LWIEDSENGADAFCLELHESDGPARVNAFLPDVKDIQISQA
jgi:hypothetical protein